MPGLLSVRTHLLVALSICAGGTVASWWLLTDHANAWPTWLACWLGIVNLVTFVYYGLDKSLAIRAAWRVPEVVLHTLSAIGGSPAAFIAMRLFRHKTIKSSFRILFWGIVLLQIALAAYIVKLLWWP